MLQQNSRSILFGGLIAMLSMYGSGSLAAQRTSPVVSHGKAVYTAVGCYTCHGQSGGGSIYTGPPLVPLDLSDEALAAYVRAPSGLMPPFSEKMLSDKDLKAIGAYLRSLPAGRPAAQIPLLAPYVKPSKGN